MKIVRMTTKLLGDVGLLGGGRSVYFVSAAADPHATMKDGGALLFPSWGGGPERYAGGVDRARKGTGLAGLGGGAGRVRTGWAPAAQQLRFCYSLAALGLCESLLCFTGRGGLLAGRSRGTKTLGIKERKRWGGDLGSGPRLATGLFRLFGNVAARGGGAEGGV